MKAWERRRLGRALETAARRALRAVPAPLIVAAAFASAWSIHAWARARMAAGTPAPCGLQVVVPQRAGRLVWVVGPSAGAVRAGDVVARLEGAGGGYELNSPGGGVVRSVMRKAGDAVQPGDPLLVLGPPPGTACP